MPDTPSDRAAAVSLRSKVGSLRMGARMANELGPTLDYARGELEANPRAVARVVRPLSHEVAARLVDGVEDMARRRLAYLIDGWRREAGVDLRRPRQVGTLRFERGDVERHLARAADHAVSVGSVDTFGRHLRTVSRSAANAAHNAAVLAIARANPDVVSGLATVVTLDGRTSDVCEPRFNSGWSMPSGHPLPWSQWRGKFPGRPPWHFNCRTFLTPVFAGDGPPGMVTEWDAPVTALRPFFPEAVRLFRDGKLTTSQFVSRLESDDVRPGTDV